MRVDIVTHCWRFSRALTYQISSLILHPPRRVQATLHVVYTPEDEATLRVLNWGRQLLYKPTEDQILMRNPNIRLAGWPVPRSILVNRTIMRNQLAKNSAADCIWMADADYCFGKGCLDALANVDWLLTPLAYPREYLCHVDHETGLRALAAVASAPALVERPDSEFFVRLTRKPVGGVQILGGHTARNLGYCDSIPGLLRPYADGEWRYSTKGDTAIRKILGPGRPIDIPNLYRIREPQNQCDVLPV